MKKLLLPLLMSILTVSILAAPTVTANVNDFHFSDFTADYYLKKDTTHGSILKVSEHLTAEFPNFNQNKGIIRAISKTNNGGKNRVLAKNFEVTISRNSQPEPIYETENAKDAYFVSTGTEDFILGTQEFNLQYEFIRVITDFDGYQELYWNTTGTGWDQSFDKITARVHLSDDILSNFTGETKCFIGEHGSNNEVGCKISQQGSVLTFESIDAGAISSKVPAHSTLTFVLKFQPDSFAVPEPDNNYEIFWLSVGAAGLFTLLIVLALWRYIVEIHRPKKTHKKFVVPQYLPPKNITVTETAGIYSKKGGNVIAAQIIDLAVRHKIKLIEESKGTSKNVKYSIEIIDDKGWLNGDIELLQAFDSTVAMNVTVDLSTVDYHRKVGMAKYFTNNKSSLRKLGLIKPSEQIWLAALGFVSTIATVVLYAIGINMIDAAVGDIIYGGTTLLYTCFVIGIVVSVVYMMLVGQEKQWANLTAKGFDMYYYLKGLEEYIKLAETERLKFLQSPNTAQRIKLNDKKAVVKLYEKILPYAMIFHQEKQWAKQLELYYDQAKYTPDWYSGAHFNAALLASSVSNFSSNMSSHYGAGGGSSSSSGFSGGGAGGGGGGGGGGGR
jgi:uncharacterized membrane protein YgcG